MTTITIDKSKFRAEPKLDLTQFTHLWWAIIPEVQPRTRIRVGQRKLLVRCKVKQMTACGAAVYSEKVGGNFLDYFNVTPSPIHRKCGDGIRYTLNWDKF